MITFASLISGSSGNATLVSDGKTYLLIDCGMSGIALKKSLATIDLSPDDLDALLVTHEHGDHARGIGVLARRHQLPVYTTENTFNSMSSLGTMPTMKPVKSGEPFEIGTIGVCPFSIPHDAVSPVGYNFFVEKEKITVATDMGHIHDGLVPYLKGSNRILLESNHDIEMLKMGSYPFPLKQRILSDFGHLSNDSAAKTVCSLIQTGTEHIMLGHLSLENNNPNVAYLTAENAMSSNGICLKKDATLTVAKRDSVTICGG